jgi:hypothetical protein
MEEHCADLRNVTEGDSVTIETSDGHRFTESECITYQNSQAAPETAEVRNSKLWEFRVSDNKRLVASITDGLKSSASDGEFPMHKEASLGESSQTTEREGVGYISSVEIHSLNRRQT